jgi:hypothetical protein
MVSHGRRLRSSGSPELPPLRRSPHSSQSQSQSRSQSRRNTQPTLPKTMSYIFTHGLFKHTLLETDPPSVQYTCLQSSCNYSTKVVGTKLQSTGNLNQHYIIHHKGIPRSLLEEQQLKKSQQPETPDFFRKYNSGTGDNIRKLILYVIVSNNLPLSLVESPSFRALIEALNPTVMPISRRTLMRDITALFTIG